VNGPLPPVVVALMVDAPYVVDASITVTVGHTTTTLGNTCSLHAGDRENPPAPSVTLAE